MPHYPEWPVPREGMQFGLEGPDAEFLVETDVYDQVVYKDIHPLPEEWEIITPSDALPYLPKRIEPLKLTLGVQEKKTLDLPTLGSIKLGDHLKYKKGYILNTGSSVWGLDFAHKLEENNSDPTIHYLAVAGYKGSTEEHIGMNEIQPTGTYKNCIQIWKLKLSITEEEDPVLDLCLLHDFGVILDLRWCPYGTYEEDSEHGLPKLGILTVTCGDGTVRTIVVPHPVAVRQQLNEPVDSNQTVYMKIKLARCTFHIKDYTPMRLTWGGHKKIAVGYTSGSVIIWDMASALAGNKIKQESECLPYVLQSTLMLDSSVNQLCWDNIADPQRLVVTGYDGRIVVIDTNDPEHQILLVRLRNVARASTWVGHCPAAFFADNDGVVRGVMFNENGTLNSQKYGYTPGTFWDIAGSEHHIHIGWVTSLGWLRTSNIHQERSRYTLVNAYSVYKLDYSETTKTYRYIDGIGLQSMDSSKKLNTYQQYGETPMALQKVVWNPNKRTSGFIATGSVAGLCRIDFEGRGSKWE